MLTTEVDLRWHPFTKEYYTDKGYIFTKYKESFSVKIEDVQKGSNVKVSVECNYCGETFEITFKRYNVVIESDNPKIACRHCTYKKSSEGNLRRYGVESTSQLKEVQDRIKQTNIEKYGVENPFQSDMIKEKIKKSMMDRYGADNPMKVEEIKRQFMGSNSNLWRGGTSSERDRVKNSGEYRQWRHSVYERDSYTCQCCMDDRGGNLHAHHIVNFSENKYLRFDVGNGITLCSDCHNPSTYGSFHHMYGTKNNTMEQLEEYIELYKKDASKVFADLI